MPPAFTTDERAVLCTMFSLLSSISLSVVSVAAVLAILRGVVSDGLGTVMVIGSIGFLLGFAEVVRTASSD